MKTCQKCKINLPISSFHKDRTNPDGLNRWCIDCKRISRFKNCEQPLVYLKRRFDSMGKHDHKYKRFRARREITFKQLKELFSDFKLNNILKGLDPHACAYTEETMTFIQGKGQVGTNLSVDRIINDKPYTKDNITFCTQKFNHIKGSITVSAFTKILKVMKEKGINYEVE